ncbi:uncharacterized protein LOC134200831 [Bombyx mori]|uniref:uncharacterized protein LOC134200831 n=1 Tax=Bombyx mori TaxID=7091 RepID=UPI002ED3CBA9
MEALTQIEDNITMIATYNFKGMKVQWKETFCKIIRFKWVKDFVNAFFQPAITRCPWPVGNYSIIDMELPPKNLHLPLSQGKLDPSVDFLITGTNTYVLRITMLLVLT